MYQRKKVNIFQMPETLFGFLWFFLKPRLGAFSIYCSYAIFYTIEAVGVQFLFSRLIDLLGNSYKDMNHVYSTLLLLLGAYIIVGVGDFISQFGRNRLIPNIEADMRLALFERVQSYPLNYFSENMEGKIENRISEMVDGISDIIESFCNRFLPIFINSMAVIISILNNNKKIGIILLAWTIIHVSICLLMGKIASSYAMKFYDRQNQLTGIIIDSLSNSHIKYLFGMQDAEMKYLFKVQQEEQQANKAFYGKILQINTILWILLLIFLILFITTIIAAWKADKLKSSQIVFIFNTSWSLTGIIWALSKDFSQFFGNIGQCRQSITVVLDCKPIVNDPNLSDLKFIQGEIEMKNVSCKKILENKTEISILKNINIKITPRQKLCIVGPSGSGKSSFIKAILNVLDITEGQVTIDNQNISEISYSSLIKYIANVSQDTNLFNRSIEENLKCGRNVSREEMIEATKKAEVYEDIERLGWDFEVGSKGNKLSGGQKQRISIARALIGKPEILLFDEPFSSLDAETENAIHNKIMNDIFKDKTVILITHRLVNTFTADRVIFMEKGQIVEDGTPEKLTQQKGRFYEMYLEQDSKILNSNLE